MNYGFTIRHNDSNEFPVTLKLTSEVSLYSYKKSLYKESQKTFKLSEDLTSNSFSGFLSFVRYLTFDEHINILINELFI